MQSPCDLKLVCSFGDVKSSFDLLMSHPILCHRALKFSALKFIVIIRLTNAVQAAMVFSIFNQYLCIVRVVNDVEHDSSFYGEHCSHIVSC